MPRHEDDVTNQPVERWTDLTPKQQQARRNIYLNWYGTRHEDPLYQSDRYLRHLEMQKYRNYLSSRFVETQTFDQWLLYQNDFKFEGGSKWDLLEYRRSKNAKA